MTCSIVTPFLVMLPEWQHKFPLSLMLTFILEIIGDILWSFVACVAWESFHEGECDATEQLPVISTKASLESFVNRLVVPVNPGGFSAHRETRDRTGFGPPIKGKLANKACTRMPTFREDLLWWIALYSRWNACGITEIRSGAAWPRQIRISRHLPSPSTVACDRSMAPLHWK